MVSTFMEGVDPDLYTFSYTYLNKIFDKYPEIVVKNLQALGDDDKKSLLDDLKKQSNSLFKDYHSKMTTYKRKYHVDPIINAVSILPKDELATMAETLVNLTSFKRRVTLDTETVGGPIDVAVISRGDGFIWIKRKHYFKPELNFQFFSNYFKKGDKYE